MAESEAALVSRLVSRGTEEISDLMVRVQTAREEVAQYKDFDYGTHLGHPCRSNFLQR